MTDRRTLCLEKHAAHSAIRAERSNVTRSEMLAVGA
jgi:hypothetical protein